MKVSGGSPNMTSIHPCYCAERWKTFMACSSGLTKQVSGGTFSWASL